MSNSVTIDEDGNGARTFDKEGHCPDTSGNRVFR